MTNVTLHRSDGWPLWLKNIDASIPVIGQYVLHGATRDLQLLTTQGEAQLTSTPDALWQMLERNGFTALLIHTPETLTVWPPNSDAACVAGRNALGVWQAALESGCDYENLTRVVQTLSASDEPVALIIDYVSQAQPSGVPVPEPVHNVMVSSIQSVHCGRAHLHKLARNVPLRHPIFWVVDRPSDLPGWMVSGDGIRQVSLPVPNLEARSVAAPFLLRSVPGWETLGNEDRSKLEADFSAMSDGLSLRGMHDVTRLAKDRNTDVRRIDDSVREFRVGLTESPWKGRALKQRISEGEKSLSERVLGQPRAIRQTLDLLVRSATGLTAAHQRTQGTGPRGVLFFTGPTGVGKTELAKAITHLIFGDESAFARFDMSEFAMEHSEARLLGAPPGYVGHGGGGELTNAVRRRPFSLLLFDEIEKAHPRILDKFLQILSDGRLTDGSGDTVYFTESVIVFTSNIGATSVGVPDMAESSSSQRFEASMRNSVEQHFTEILKRPELYGRIGDGNVVVFQPIGRDIAKSLASKYVANVIRRVQEQLDITLTVPQEIETQIITLVTVDLSKGGRGIGTSLEMLFVNPLARVVFGMTSPRSLTVTRLSTDPDGSPVVHVE